MTTWIAVPILTTPWAPAALSAASSTWLGSTTSVRRRVMQPSTSSMFSIPPSPATIFSALLAMSFSLVSRRPRAAHLGPFRHGNARLAQLHGRVIGRHQ